MMFVVLLIAPTPALALSAVDMNTQESAPPQASGIGIRLVDIPTATQNDPRARSYIIDRLSPGMTIERRVEVQNNTDSSQLVRVYVGAAGIQGGSFVGEDGAAENELTSWSSVAQPQLQMAAGESTDVRITIDVPPDAAENELYAAVWAEVRSPVNAETNIVSASRVGIRIYLSVGPGNGAPANFEIMSLTAKRNQSGNPAVVASVSNTGGRALDISGTLSLTKGPSGLSAGPFSSDAVVTVAPGGSVELGVTLDPGLPDGPWQAELDLKSGLVSHTATAEITFPDTGESEPVRTEEGPDPLLIAGGAGAIVVIAVALGIWLRRRRMSLVAQNTSHQ
ncbi:hypothetical protein [Cryobacterium psychrophilum]|uniref:Peptidase n=1 Tax=Cryobacterium psychrophilum TaxID=41988 RepID=A0A4Y8KJP4_9MICO|nr:hypothetical protein [Cryobacterium psychrophilum]TFD75308.1 hypothetical protein E3T53_16005 [Cryobacterium psychrophilum]